MDFHANSMARGMAEALCKPGSIGLRVEGLGFWVQAGNKAVSINRGTSM